jgi:hypothetical protein
MANRAKRNNTRELVAVGRELNQIKRSTSRFDKGEQALAITLTIHSELRMTFRDVFQHRAV